MTLIFPNNDFLNELFPGTKNNKNALETAIKEYYSQGSLEPEIEIGEDFIKVTVPTGNEEVEKNKYQKLVSLCEASRFEEAKPLAEELIRKSPAFSEYHRILGQIYSELGDQEEAINSLIDALRWNPKNEWALLMMGNIFARFKQDIETALTYYNQVLKVKPDDHITLNNIGANLMQLGKRDEATVYFEKALNANPTYPNTHFAMAMLAEREGDYLEAFNTALKALENHSKKDGFYQNCLQFVLETAKKYRETFDATQIIKKFTEELSQTTQHPIQIEEDDSIPTAAKIEYAENYDRNFHLVKYKSGYPAVEHLILHELIHLQLATEAKADNSNKLFVSNENFKAKFFSAFEKQAVKLRKKGNNQTAVTNYLTALFNGLNSQVYNTPIDLFIEDRIYNNFQEMRPLQFISLLSLIQEGITATTKKDIVKEAPASVISKSKIFNITNALLFKDLFKVNLIPEHEPSRLELQQAKTFFNEFLEYRGNKEPGEEYELVQHWGEDLKLDFYFELVPEEEYRRKTIDQVISEMEKDPFGLENPDPAKDRKLKMFLKEHSSGDINSAVVMYMVDALQSFKKLPHEEIKKIALELATIGMGGIDPKKKEGYEIPSIPGSNFSGYKTLAYYYVSWALAMPELLQSLSMPFDNEYQLAKKFI